MSETIPTYPARCAAEQALSEILRDGILIVSWNEAVLVIAAKIDEIADIEFEAGQQ